MEGTLRMVAMASLYLLSNQREATGEGQLR